MRSGVPRRTRCPRSQCFRSQCFRVQCFAVQLDRVQCFRVQCSTPESIDPGLVRIESAGFAGSSRRGAAGESDFGFSHIAGVIATADEGAAGHFLKAHALGDFG